MIKGWVTTVVKRLLYYTETPLYQDLCLVEEYEGPWENIALAVFVKKSAKAF